MGFTIDFGEFGPAIPMNNTGGYRVGNRGYQPKDRVRLQPWPGDGGCTCRNCARQNEHGPGQLSPKEWAEAMERGGIQEVARLKMERFKEKKEHRAKIEERAFNRRLEVLLRIDPTS